MFWFLILLILLLNNCTTSRSSHDLYDIDDDDGYDSDDTQSTNINEIFDVALEELWPMVIKNKLDTTKLPDIVEGFSYRPLFINYNAGLVLNNGMVWNIHRITRFGDAIMTLDKKVLKFTGHILIDKIDFSYDFTATVMGIATRGTVIGSVADTIIAGEFEIQLINTNFYLKDLKIISFGDMSVQLKSNVVVRWISEPFLRTITRLFQTRITTTVSDGVREYIRKIVEDINKNDRLHIKKFVHFIIPVLNVNVKDKT